MIFTATELQGAFVLDLQKFEDARGFFAHAWARAEFERHGLDPRVHDLNLSHNAASGTLRGMHFQTAPYAQAKTLRCIRGAIYDVIIDLRPGSATFRRWIGAELSAANGRALYVPEGFAHGFQTLEDDTDVMYLVSTAYAPGSEGGVRYDDQAFGIQWPREVTVVSDKDAAWPIVEG